MLSEHDIPDPVPGWFNADAATTGTHLCPGCGANVRHGQVGCETCWKAIPTRKREPLRQAFRRRVQDPIGYARAVQQATDLIKQYSPHRKENP